MTRHSEHFRLSDATLRIDSTPIAGRDLILAPGAEERAALADRLRVTAVDALGVKLHAVRFRGGFRVTGRLTATIVQPSVVSLEPVTQSIAEPIDRIFLPGGEKDFADAADAEIFVDPDGEDLPDHFEGQEADLTELIVETIALAIDPYPRGPGESLETLGLKLDPSEESPFAALKALKDKK